MADLTDRETWLLHYFGMIPELLAHMREMVSPIRSSWPTGMPRAASPDPSPPLSLDPADDAEALWRELQHFVSLVESRTGERAPYIGGGGIRDWPSWASELVAKAIVEWLRTCTFRIAHDEFFEQYFTQPVHLVTLISNSGVKYPLDRPSAPPTFRAYRPVECPTCLEHAVRAVFDDEGVREFVCDDCRQRFTREEWIVYEKQRRAADG